MVSKVSKIASPRIPSILTNGGDFTEQIDNFRYELEELVFKDGDVSGQQKQHLLFSSSLFEKCNFSEGKFPGGRYCDIIFRNCDLSNADFSGSTFTRVEFVDCKLAGTKLLNCKFNHVVWKSCLCRYAIWTQSGLTNCLFEETNLQAGAMDDCKWEQIIFDRCDLREIEFYHTPLKNISFITSVIDGIRVNGPELRGAEVTSLQAIGLAHLLGVKIKG